MNRVLPVVLVALIIGAAAGFALGFEVGTRSGPGPSTQSTSSFTHTTSRKTTSTGPAAHGMMGQVQVLDPSLTPAEGALFKNVTYCDDGSNGGLQQLDIWYPTSGFTDSNPVVVWIHGGGWTKGNGPDGGGFPDPFFPGTNLLANGFILVSINYRLAPQYTYPAQEFDAQCAIAFVRDNAAALMANSNEIDVGGASAGGHIASWVGVNNTAPYQVSAVGIISGPENVSAVYPSFPVWTKAVSNAWGDNSALKYAGSPINFVSASDPPFFIEHGYNDTVVPYQQAVAMYDAMSAVGANVQLVLVNCAGHILAPIPHAACSPTPSASVTTRDLFAFYESHP